MSKNSPLIKDLSHNDLAGFYNFIAENNIINSIVYYSGKLSPQIKTRQNKMELRSCM